MPKSVQVQVLLSAPSLRGCNRESRRTSVNIGVSKSFFRCFRPFNPPYIHSCALHNCSKIAVQKPYYILLKFWKSRNINRLFSTGLYFCFSFRPLIQHYKLSCFHLNMYSISLIALIFVPICNTISYSIKAPLLMCYLHQEGYIILRTTKMLRISTF